VPSRPSSSWPAGRSSVVWDDLRRALDELGQLRGRGLVVVDAGGGSGGYAVPVAQLGHQVIVVDPSPDSLASLERRAAEAGVGEQVSARQGDLDTLGEAVGSAQADVVLCHDVLEVADDPGAGLAAAAAALRPGGILSVLAANRSAAVLGRVLAGRFEAAEHVLSGDAPTGTDRALRRFDLDELVALTSAVGLSVVELSGDRVFSDLVPGAALDIEPHSQEVLARLEAIVARLPVYRSMATRLHLLARKPEADTLAAK
jgi:2-polyprenyl-3-methyl-5-hydroxy-6-metoxy-1,4-benzoquinol methylase